jgi:hypothetical protein
MKIEHKTKDLSWLHETSTQQPFLFAPNGDSSSLFLAKNPFLLIKEWSNFAQEYCLGKPIPTVMSILATVLMVL